MRRLLVLLLLTLSIPACTDTSDDTSKRELTRQEKDSILAESPLPGAGVVGKAIEAADSSAARAGRLDGLSE